MNTLRRRSPPRRVSLALWVFTLALILGFSVRESLISLGFVLAVVTFGHLLKEPLYEFHTHVIPRLALLLFILILPREDDRFSVDYLLARRNNRGAGE